MYNANSDEMLRDLLEEGIRFDLILTDPPYNLKKDFGNGSDNLPLSELKVTRRRIEMLEILLTPEGSIVWFGIHKYIGFIQVIMYDLGLHYRRMNIWKCENGLVGQGLCLPRNMSRFFGTPSLQENGHTMRMMCAYLIKVLRG